MTKRAEPNDDRARYLYVKRPRCPACKGVRLLVYKTIRSADGSLTRRARCRDCNKRIIMVVD